MKAAHNFCTATVSTIELRPDRSKKLTVWSRMLLEKLTVPQLVKKFHHLNNN
jgi:hypothetical protein